MTTSNIIRSIIVATFVMVCATAGARSLLEIYSIAVERSAAGDRLDIDIDIASDRVLAGRDKEVVFVPVVVSDDGTDSVRLESVTIAGRNRYYSHLRNDNSVASATYMSGAANTISYHATTPWQQWMEHSRVDMLQEVRGCCDRNTANGTADIPLAALDMIPVPFTGSSDIMPLTGDAAIKRVAEGKAFVDFVVNRTEIRPTYRRNEEELGKILSSIDTVKNDPDAIITSITIKGYASPEGSYDNNVRLAMGRTQALKEYVREHYDFAPEIMHTDYEPEDWQGLCAFLDTCTLPHSKELLAIASGNLEPDARDHELRRRYPAEYKVLLDSIYPALRHSDYTIKYRFRTYMGIDELRKMYSEHPDRLRPVDFQRLAAEYEPWSEPWEQIYLTAAAVHPADKEAAYMRRLIEEKRNRPLELKVDYLITPATPEKQ